jgi:hypothetical protein
MALTASIALAGVAVSAYQGNRARSQARDQMSAGERAQQEQVAAMREMQGEARQRYDEWRSTFMPAVEQMGQLAMREARPDYEQIDADVGMSFDMAQGQNRRQLERFGVNPADGASQASERDYSVGRALATVNGRNQARNVAQDQQWQRLAGFAGLGEGMRSSADSMMSAAYGGIASAFGGQAGQNFGMAQQSQARSDAAWADAASGAGYIAGNMMNRPAPSTMYGDSGAIQRSPTSFRAPNFAGTPNVPTGPIYRTGG